MVSKSGVKKLSSSLASASAVNSGGTHFKSKIPPLNLLNMLNFNEDCNPKKEFSNEVTAANNS